MRLGKDNTLAARIVATVGILVGMALIGSAQQAQGGERKFLVFLANSPKSYPDSNGAPVGGLPPRSQIDDEYFDKLNPGIGSFAEYWEEISYRDVTITGLTTDWFSLPWSVRPPDVDGNPNSPENYYDLNDTGFYEYGAGEQFRNFFAMVIIDLNGDPDNNDDGPFSVGPGAFDVTRDSIPGVTRWPVWRPGERFVDVDNDNKWDGLDEATNTMDHDADGKPDLAGPWIDLNGDGNPENADDDCIYLTDSDNDGNPDCCPNTPTGGPCDCSPITWTQGDGLSVFVDCNGNFVPDECDILTNDDGEPCFGEECNITQDCIDTGWPAKDSLCLKCGFSRDELPFSENPGDSNRCTLPSPDQIPDDCQFLEAELDQATAPDCKEPGAAGEGGCSSKTECTRPNTAIEPTERCEFDDSNANNSLDIVEPFENFLRRWDPCMTDPDVHPANLFTNATHWVKAYDPHSQAADVTCSDPLTSMNYTASTANQPAGPLHRASYIENNYPGDWRAVEAMAHSRMIWGSHDPLDLLEAGECHCPILCATDDDCPGGANAVCDTSLHLCECVDDPEIYDMFGRVINPAVTLTKACPAGAHADYDPPDRWINVIDDQNPSEITRYTTKLRARPGPFREAGYLVQRTPEPGTTNLADETEWFDQSWKDRYPGGPTHPLSEVPGYQGCDDPNSELGFIDCEVPLWPESSPPGFENVLEIVPFNDVDPDEYTNNVFYHRRFFSANWGGVNGDGTGWTRDGCGDLGPFILFETGVLSDEDISFVQGCDAAILPEEVNGAGSEAEFYDGWVEHDDLPSSKYHKAGDQRLGEITSPFSYTQEYTPPWGADDDPQPVQVPMIWGEDLGDHNPNSPRDLDAIIAAAGPYATNIHGNFGRDAGNLLTMEWLTWRTEPPFNNGTAWAQYYGFHPYAGPFGANLGFRDYNLDGLIDQGEVRPPGSENYIADSIDGTANNGSDSAYPFNRRRLLEDCVEVVDRSVDFDEFVDTDAMNAATRCGGNSFLVGIGSHLAPYPAEYRREFAPVIPSAGIASGIVLMPTLPGDDGGGGLFPLAPNFFPIHNDDGLNNEGSPDALLPAEGTPQLSWNLFFHDLVKIMDDGTAGPATVGFETAYAAHEYLHSWEKFPDLYDYDVFALDDTGVIINCPVGAWDIMANGGLVHPTPPLKENNCSQWIRPVDLATILTPGVPTVLTLPPAEIVRDDAYYFLENEANPGERIYLWSAGIGFDLPGSPGRGAFAGRGVMILHTELGNESDSRPPQQSDFPFQYNIIQADGLRELEDGYTQGSNISCPAIADAGDPWPGSSDNRLFDCDTNPPSRWNQGNQCTGLTVSDFELDGFGGATVTVTWQPTSIPSLEFVDPPGGVSVNDTYSIKFLANDVHGGTTIELYYTSDEDSLVLDAAHRIGTLDKNIPGRIELNADWDISDVADGRYFLFAKLVPGPGADGSEKFRTNPRPGRNNTGTGVLLVPNGNSGVNISGNKARLETWTLRLLDVAPDGVQDWIVNSTLSQPVPEDPADDPYPHLTVDTDGVGAYDVDQVTFWLYNKSCSDNGDPCIVAGDCDSAGATCNRGPAFEIGDTWSFTTTGITALSRPVTIEDGEINEGPKAVISAIPVSGDPPLTVTFDGLSSTEPNGASLTYAWDFGDGTPGSGPFQVHIFNDAKTYTVVLRVTSTLSGLFDETTVDIEVTNNTPSATIIASPLSGTPGPLGLLVNFDGTSSTDTETDPNALIYQWNFGDGSTANDAGLPGFLSSTSHRYTSDASDNCGGHAGIACYFATLTITDEGGKQDVATVEITVGNTRPIVSISHSVAAGPAPWEVVFNASGSSDPDGDELRVDWLWGDGSSDLDLPLSGMSGATDGSVPHTFTATGQYFVTAKVSDDRGGVTDWPGVTVTVSEAAVGASDPRAIFTIDPTNPEVDEEVTVDASLSFDRPVGSPSAGIASYTWNWGDGADVGSGKIAKHTYTAKGTYTITLTVADQENPPNTSGISKTVIVVGVGESEDEDEDEDNERPIAAFTVNPSVGQAGVTEFSFDAGASVDPDEDTLTYSWNYRDGSLTETGQTTTHVFERTGTFNVILTVRDPSNAVATATVQVTVTTDVPNTAPFAIIATGPRAGSAAFAVQLDGSLSYDPDGDPLTYSWSQNGIVQSDKTEAKATFVFETAGDYEIVLTVNDGKVGGETSSQPVNIHVNGQSGGGDPDPGQGVPDDNEPDGSTGGSTGGPFAFCAPGMLTSLFGALLGLSAMRLTRRRRY